MSTQLKRLKQINKAFIDFLEELNEFVTGKLDGASTSQIKLRLADLIVHFNSFQKNQLELESLDDEQGKSDIRSVVGRHYYTLRPALEEKLEDIKQKKGVVPAIQPDHLTFIPKLPEITLDSFTGEITKWKSFIESFNNHVHNNPKLNDLTKFQYLKHSVKGIAAKSFENLDFVAANYEEARRLLFERFDRPNQIVEEHIKSLFNIKPVDKANSGKLLNLIDDFNAHIRSLNTLGRPVQYWDDLLVYLMVSKFDAETKLKWRDQAPHNALPTFKNVCDFVQNRCDRMYNKAEPNLVTSSKVQNDQKPVSLMREPRITSAFTTTKLYNCAFCNKSGHSIMRCYQFLAMSATERIKFAETLQLCANCLRSSHNLTQCNIKDRCRLCQAKHHTLLHLKLQDAKSPDQGISIENRQSDLARNSQTGNSNVFQISDTSKLNKVAMNPKFVFLATALVDILDANGLKVTARVLLDSGSQLNFITDSLAKRLNIKTAVSHMNINGIDGTPTSSSRCAMLNVHSRLNNHSLKIEAYVLRKISEYHPSMTDVSDWPIPHNIHLADPEFFNSRAIDILIGAEIYAKLQSVGQIKLAENLPSLQNTMLGWVVLGAATTSTFCNVVATEMDSERLDELLERTWENDQCDATSTNPLDNNECELHFRNTFARHVSGKFVVRLPFTKSPLVLGESATRARKRFLSLESKLDQNSELRVSYNKFMSEYENLNHMELVETVKTSNFYLPHHCVLKPDSSSTKLRVVFDGSAKTSTSYSLNEILMTGPVIQNELFAILIRFRSHLYAHLLALKIHWDESLPFVQHIYWLNCLENLNDLNSIKISRHSFKSCQHPQDIHFHGFADACEKAYGATIYVRFRDSNNKYFVTLLCSKSRVAPLNQLTLPRLDLCAALLLVKLMEKVASLVNCTVNDYFYWTDSNITLCWINSSSTRWKTYGANRVSVIQSRSKSKNWLHIDSKSNPADIVSRGMTPKLLLSSDLWWNGPPFLLSTDEMWNGNNLIFGQNIELPEQRNVTAISSTSVKEYDDALGRIHSKNSFKTVCKSMAYVTRFVHNSRNPKKRRFGELTTGEIEQGLTMTLRSIQASSFPEIYHGLHRNDYKIRDPSLKSLSIFLDDHKILRAGGRLQFSALSYASRHAILLPKDHFFPYTIMAHIHVKHLHVGQQGLLAATRQTYWPINGKQLAKKVCRKCVHGKSPTFALFQSILTTRHRMLNVGEYVNGR